MKSNMTSGNDLPNVSIVVVGHDEARNLDACFSAIRNMNYPQEKLEVLYIDSKSSDNSVEVACKYTDKIFQEKSKWPTAGEAFNRGIIESSHDFIHITGGDIQLHPEYLKKAIKTLVNREDIHCVTGFFTEKTMTGWNKILAYRREDDTNSNDHYVFSPNGGTFKKDAFLIVNGYDERIKKGQESELGKRFQEAGLKIWYMHIPQGVHDFELHTVVDMAKRSYGIGYSLGHLLLLSFYEKNNIHLVPFRKSAIRSLLFNGTLLSLLVLMIFLGGSFYAFLWLLIYFLYYPAKVFLKQRNRTRNNKIYFLFMGYFSIFSFFGIVGIFLYYMKLKIRGIALLHPWMGLRKSRNGLV